MSAHSVYFRHSSYVMRGFAVVLFCLLTHCSPAPKKIAVGFPLEKPANAVPRVYASEPSLQQTVPALQQDLPALQQQWWVTYQTQAYPLQVYIEPDLPHWKMVITNNLGQRILSVDSLNSQPILGDAGHPLHSIYADLVDAAHWSFWPITELMWDKRWTFNAQAARREIYFSGILRATVEGLEICHQHQGDKNCGWVGRYHYISYARSGHPAFEIAIESSLSE